MNKRKTILLAIAFICLIAGCCFLVRSLMGHRGWSLPAALFLICAGNLITFFANKK